MNQRELKELLNSNARWITTCNKENIKDYIKERDVKVIKKNRWRQVLKAGDLYLKLFKLKRLQRAFNLDPAKKEFDISLILHKRKRSAEPLAYAVKDSISLFVSREIKGKSLESLLKENWDTLPIYKKRVFFCKFISFLIDLKELGMFQPDFHLNNIFWDEELEEFKLIDLHRANLIASPLSDLEFLEQLRYLLPPFMKYLSYWDILRFTQLLSKEIAHLRKRSCRLFLIELSYKDMRRQYLKKIPKKIERCFNKTNKKSLKLFKTTYASEDIINYVLERFFLKNDIKNNSLKILKDSRHTFCVKFTLKDSPFFLKAYRSSSYLKGVTYFFRQPRAIKVWYASFNLIYRDINTPQPLFLIQGRNPWKNFYGVLAYEWVYELENKETVLKKILLNEKEQAFFLKKLALFIWNMHMKGVFHGDCKITNFYFDQYGNIGIFDLDALKFKKDFSKMLAQRDIKRMARSLDNFLPSMELGKKFISNYQFLKPDLEI